MQYLNMERSIQRGVERLTEDQRRVVTGRRLDLPSDDPAGVVQALSLRNVLSRDQQYQRNVREAKQFLQSTEASLGDIQQILRETREIVVRGANDGGDHDSRQALIDQLERMMQRLYQIGNTKVDDERYLFAGQLLTTQPFTLNGDVLTYNGDGNALVANIATNQQIQMNLTPGTRIVDLYDRLKQIKINLLSSDLTRLSNEDLREIENFQSEFLRYRGEIGTRLQELDQRQTMYELRHEQHSEMLANIEEVDIAGAISQLRQSEIAYQAALQTTARLQGLNLFEF
jgi:flagellar hook-associated protein 3 FlgL